MSGVTLKLPWPPSVNNYKEPYSYKKGRRRLTQFRLNDRARKYRSDAIAAIWEKLGMPTPSVSRLRLTIVFVPPDRRKRDLDNHVKGIQDAMTHAKVYKDDSQIDELRLIRGPVESPGWVEVTIELIAKPEQIELKFADETAPW